MSKLMEVASVEGFAPPDVIAFKMWRAKDDHSRFIPGPWDREPDKAQWIDPATNLDCLVVRNNALCGYVGAPPGHPWHGVEHYACSQPNPCEGDWCGHSLESKIHVHGALSYSGFCTDHICHIPEPGRPDAVWWLGFDCSHSSDLAPVRVELADLVGGPGDRSYRDFAYVVEHVQGLARQIADVAS